MIEVDFSGELSPSGSNLQDLFPRCADEEEGWKVSRVFFCVYTTVTENQQPLEWEMGVAG